MFYAEDVGVGSTAEGGPGPGALGAAVLMVDMPEEVALLAAGVTGL